MCPSLSALPKSLILSLQGIEMDMKFIPIIQTRTLSLRELHNLKGPTTSKWQSLDSNPGNIAPELDTLNGSNTQESSFFYPNYSWNKSYFEF